MGKTLFYDDSVRIPLIISPPDRKGRGECDGLTELIDVTSTKNDPGETTNLVDDRSQESVIRELTQVIRDHRSD